MSCAHRNNVLVLKHKLLLEVESIKFLELYFFTPANKRWIQQLHLQQQQQQPQSPKSPRIISNEQVPLTDAQVQQFFAALDTNAALHDILRFTVCRFSRQLCEHLLQMGYQIFAADALLFLSEVHHMSVNLLRIEQDKLVQPDQLLEDHLDKLGPSSRKLRYVLEVVRKCKRLHNSLVYANNTNLSPSSASSSSSPSSSPVSPRVRSPHAHAHEEERAPHASSPASRTASPLSLPPPPPPVTPRKGLSLSRDHRIAAATDAEYDNNDDNTTGNTTGSESDSIPTNNGGGTRRRQYHQHHHHKRHNHHHKRQPSHHRWFSSMMTLDQQCWLQSFSSTSTSSISLDDNSFDRTTTSK
eukprot:GEZU01023713.1.p1 GENE.GEZU01023713.1~~GEZU01023713.1.p1  ORF type:complete len:355 (+),score=90.37 GEZU01023713.1:204-1268(+)